MRNSKFQLTAGLAIAAVILGLKLAAIQPAAARAFDGEAYAIVNARIVTVTGSTIPKGALVIRNGLIEAVGADISVPGDARLIDASGLTIYPGLFDAYTNLGLRPAPTPAGPAAADPTQAFLAQLAAPPSSTGLLPEVTVLDQMQVNATTFDQQRAAGITTVLTGPRNGIYQGQSAVINLGGESPEKLILKAPFSQNIGFNAVRGSYPGSLMGVFSFLRQSLLDARHYREAWTRYRQSPRGNQRPEVNKSMDALQPVINGEMPVIFNVSSVREIKRAVTLAEEFNLKYLLSGAQQSYQIADYLKSKNATVLLSLSFPQKPAGLEDPESESLNTLRERAKAPETAMILHKAGVRFAFTSGNLVRPGDYIVNAARAIEAGLPKDEALRALTINAARILGVSEQLGSIEKGKVANLVLTTGDLFDRNSRVRHVFVDGRKFDIKAPEAPQGRNGPGGPNGTGGTGSGRGPGAAAAPSATATMLAAGTWMLTVQTPADEVTSTLTLTQDGESLNGEVSTPFGNARITEGRIRGSEVMLNYSLSVQGQTMPVSMRGRIEGNSIRGTMEAMGQNFNFTGAKRPNQ